MGTFDWRNKKIKTSGERAKLFKYWTSYAILGVAIFSMTFFGICDYSGGPVGGPSGDAGRVGGEVISDLEFKRGLQSAYEQWRQQNPGKDYNPETDRVAERVLNQIVTGKIEFLTAKDIGLSSSQDEVVQAIQTTPYFKNEDGSFNAEGFKNYLRGNVMTEAEFTENYSQGLIQSKFSSLLNRLQFVSDYEAELEFKRRETKASYEYLKLTPALIDKQIDGAAVNEFLLVEKNLKAVKKRFELDKDRLSKKAEVKARHILIGFKGARNSTGESQKRTKENAFSLASEILGKAQKSGANFAALAKKYTDEPSGKKSGGDLGWFTADKMVKEFSDAAFPLSSGQLSSVTETPFGYHIIKVEGKKDAVVATFEKEKIRLARKLLREEKAENMLDQISREYLSRVKSGKDFSAKLKEDGLKWETTGLVSTSSSFIPGLGADSNLSLQAHSLKKEGAVTDKVITSGLNKYIIRLKELKPADMKNFENQKDYIAQNLKSQKATQLKRSLVEFKKERLEKQNRIRLSATHMQMDQAYAASNGG